MSILITGAGTIGRLTAQHLAERGDRVVLMDIHPRLGTPVPGVDYQCCDVTDYAALCQLVELHAVERIVHTAAMLSTSIRQDPLRGYAVNTMGTANVLEAARKYRLKRTVIASSTTVTYSTFASRDTRPIEEDFPMQVLSERPGSIYAAAKIANEHLSLLYADLYQVDCVVLRYGAVLSLGDGQATSVPGKLLSALIQSGQTGIPAVLDDPILLWGGKEEFVDARDCALANVCALDAPAPRQRVYNVATGHWFSLEEFIATCRTVLPHLAVDQRLEPQGGYAAFAHKRPAPSAIAAAREELGFVARHDLADTIRYYAQY